MELVCYYGNLERSPWSSRSMTPSTGNHKTVKRLLHLQGGGKNKPRETLDKPPISRLFFLRQNYFACRFKSTSRFHWQLIIIVERKINSQVNNIFFSLLPLLLRTPSPVVSTALSRQIRANVLQESVAMEMRVRMGG